jgi:secondary thiamine-phosphate synthase enzyme
MTYKTFSVDIDADGIALLTIDLPDASMNVWNGGLIEDFKQALEKLVPYNENYRHNVGEDNAASHIWRQLIGHQVTLPITKGKLDFGPWEQVFYCEFDGKREKRVYTLPTSHIHKKAFTRPKKEKMSCLDTSISTEQ